MEEEKQMLPTRVAPRKPFSFSFSTSNQVFRPPCVMFKFKVNSVKPTNKRQMWESNNNSPPLEGTLLSVNSCSTPARGYNCSLFLFLFLSIFLSSTTQHSQEQMWHSVYYFLALLLPPQLRIEPIWVPLVTWDLTCNNAIWRNKLSTNHCKTKKTKKKTKTLALIDSLFSSSIYTYT